MIEDNSILPYLKITLKKFLYLYLPILFIVSYFYSVQCSAYWLTFFLCIFTIEIIHNFSLQNYNGYKESYIVKIIGWCDKSIKYITYPLFFTKFWSIIGVVFLILYLVITVLFDIPLFVITNETLDFLKTFLPVYIGIFGVLLGLGMTTLQRTLDKYNDIATNKIISFIGLKTLLIYIVIFLTYTFTLFLFSDTSQNVYSHQFINYDFYFLVNFILLTVVFLLLTKDFLKASTAQGILKIFSNDLISILKQNRTINYFKSKNIRENYRREQARIWRQGLYITILHRGGTFLTGTPWNLTNGYFKGQTTKILKKETQVLFRIGLSSIEQKNTITFQYALKNIVDIFEAYVNFGNEYHGTDGYSLFLNQEFESLFNEALKYDSQPEFIELVVKYLGNLIIIASKTSIKNFSGMSETDVFEKQIRDFSIKSWDKKNASATSLSLSALNDIANSYLEQEKYKPLFNTLSHLLYVGDITSQLNSYWGASVTRDILHYSTQIYYNTLLKIIYSNTRREITGIYQNDFYKDLEKILKQFYSVEVNRQYEHRFTDIFYDDLYSRNFLDRSNKNRYRPIYDYFHQVIFGYNFGGRRYGGLPSKIEKRKELYTELISGLKTARIIFPIISTKRYIKMKDISGFFYGITDMIWRLCLYEKDDNLKNILISGLKDNIGVLYKDISDFEGYDEEGSTNIFSIIILLLYLLHQKFDVEDVITNILNDVIESFKHLDDKQDYHKHERRYLFKYLFFISAWTWKLFSSKKIHQDLEKFILDNKSFKKRYSDIGFGGNYDSETFEIYNYPESGIERLLRVWNTPLSCFTELEIKLLDEDYKQYCEYLNTKLEL